MEENEQAEMSQEQVQIDAIAEVNEVPSELESADAVSAETSAEVAVPQIEEKKIVESEEVKNVQETPGQADLHQEMVTRLGLLENRIKDYEEKEKIRQEAVEKEMVAAREKLLKDLGILDDLYGRLAPSLEEADPRTEEGQEKYRQWMTKHPSLFKKSPTLEKVQNAAQENEVRGNTFRKHLTFSEAIRRIKG